MKRRLRGDASRYISENCANCCRSKNTLGRAVGTVLRVFVSPREQMRSVRHAVAWRGAVRSDAARSVHSCLSTHRGVGIRHVIARATWCPVSAPRTGRAMTCRVCRWIRRPSPSPPRSLLASRLPRAWWVSRTRRAWWCRHPRTSASAHRVGVWSTPAPVGQRHDARRWWSRAAQHQYEEAVVCALRPGVACTVRAPRPGAPGRPVSGLPDRAGCKGSA